MAHRYFFNIQQKSKEQGDSEYKLKERVEGSIYNTFWIGTHRLQNNCQLLQDHEIDRDLWISVKSGGPS